MEESIFGVSDVEFKSFRQLTEVLHDVLMLKLLQKFNLALQSRQHAFLAFFVLRRAGGKLDLLDGHQQPTHGVHAKIHATKRPRPNQCAFNPFDGAFAYARTINRNTG